jgi:hypothetical protein
MFRVKRWVLRLGAFVLFAILLCIGAPGNASKVQAAQGPGGELYFDLYSVNNDLQFACVGKPINGSFLTGVQGNEPSAADPLAPLVPPEIRVTVPVDPLVGTLSKRSWTINSVNTFKSWKFTYTPTKTGDEDLVFDAMLANSPNPVITKHASFPVIYCRYKVSIHGEFENVQGGIRSDFWYDGEGHFDLSPRGGKGYQDPGSGFPIYGTGIAKLEAYSDGTDELGTTCTTTSPGQGSSTFFIDGDGAPSSTLKLNFYFGDIITSIGQTCRGKRTGAWGIPRIGWLPNSAQGGEVKDLTFSPKGESKDLDISAVNDTRFTAGSNNGTMSITVLPEVPK